MTDDIAIRAQGLSKKFKIAHERRTSLKERLIRGRAPKPEEFWALRDASFEITRGSMFGIIGHNGSGKSTALKVIAGIYRPTAGAVEVNGSLSALLELGAGFHGELSGRENIRLNASILGMSPKQITGAMDEIIDFAGLERFIDNPIKTYSSGMYVRLGFAVAVKVNPEILVVDEVIAVGDEDFQRKCFDYISSLRRQGSTIVIVTHAMGVVTDRCDTAMWLDHGAVKELGPARSVVDSYLRSVNAAEAQQEAGSTSETVSVPRLGSGEAKIVAIELLNESGEAAPFLVSGARGTIRLHYEVRRRVISAVFGLGFYNEHDDNVAGPNSGRTGSLTLEPGTAHIDFVMDSVLLSSGNYTVSTVIVVDGDFVDAMHRAFVIRVRPGTGDEPGLMLLPGSWLGPKQAPFPGATAATLIHAPDQTPQTPQREGAS